jgi:uncharacterized protein with HEPN domain
MANDKDIVKHIFGYCVEIEDEIKKFSIDYDKFYSELCYRNMLGMSLLQIGELSNSLSEEFKNQHGEIPWRRIVNMRNRFAHGYGEMKIDIIWNTIEINIPELKEFCKKIIEVNL